jgi:hypothetical protein
LLLICMSHLSLCLGRIVFVWIGLSYLLKVRETQCVLGHSLAPYFDDVGGCEQGLKRAAAYGYSYTQGDIKSKLLLPIKGTIMGTKINIIRNNKFILYVYYQ